MPGSGSCCIVPSEMSKATKTRSPLAQERRIVVAVVPPVDELDLVGPLQVFSAANRLAGKKVYAIEVATSGEGLAFSGESGPLRFLAHGYLKDLDGKFDSALVVCGVGTRLALNRRLSEWLRQAAEKSRRLGAVCVGAFLLAQAGLLDGKKATSHWRYSGELARRYPRVKVESEPVWVRDGNIYTSAGISAGMDLALAWVEEDCGSAVAHEAARELVLFLRRPSSQRQLSVSLASQASEMKAIQELQVWIADNVEKNLSMRHLAERMSMSLRNFERVFTREVGTTPAQYVLHARVESARRQLERTDRGFKQIAAAAGFGTADLMRRAFVRLLGTTPQKYRNQIRSRG